MDPNDLDFIVASCLSAYLDAKPSAQSITVLTKVLCNAATKIEAKYRTVRLANPQVHEHLVITFGALDVLSLAGFRQEEIDGDSYLFYDDSNADGKKLIFMILDQLAPLVPAQVSPKKPAAAATTPAASGANPVAAINNSVFLSEEERKERTRKMVAVKRERQKEREAVQRRIEEDKQERLLKFQRENRHLQYSPADTDGGALPIGVVVRKIHESTLDEKKPSVATAKLGPASLKVENERPPIVEQPSHPSLASSPPQDDGKPPASASEAVSQDDADKLLTGLPGCSSATGIRESSVYRDLAGGAAASSSPAKCLKRLHRELQDVMQLPVDPSIWLKYDEETPQFMRFVVAGPSGTPYAHGLFAFDMKIPNDYPLSPPSVTLLTTGSGRVRFGPNLYADGKVCLSLLGTWPGPKWNPKSTIQQLLISIQGLILGVDHPYYLEPGLGAWEGKVKDGQFKVTGHTLSGDTVAEDVGLPPEVIAFEDKIRIGTLKYAVADMMKVPSYLESFRREIQAHFYCNRDKFVREVEGWKYIPCFGYERPEIITNEMESLTSKVRAKLAALTMAELSVETATASQDISRLTELAAKDNDVELVSEQLVDVVVQDSDEDSKMPPTDQTLALLNHDMLAAASKGDYVQAGKLQQHINTITLLQQKIAQSAAEGNFIKAGQLQQHLFALLATNSSTKGSGGKLGEGPDKDRMEKEDNNMEADEEDSDDDDIKVDGDDNEEDEEEDSYDDGFDPMEDDIVPPAGIQGSYGGFNFGRNVHVPRKRREEHCNPNHSWGNGAPLASSSSLATSMSGASPMNGVVAHQNLPPESICRIRFRLPCGRTSVDDFGKDDKLSIVYETLNRHIDHTDMHRQNKAVVAPLAAGGAFAQPLSSTGYTLLLSHPKREFSFEMHGAKSLAELGLSPSATLTVMKCCHRGVVHRGELESRLAEAQNGAMDLDGLTYEGLLELTERVGGAGPSDGMDFVGLSKATLELNSALFSPATYLGSTSPGDKIDQRCPVCLGDFDPAENTQILRQLNRCGHIFHTACLETWLKTRSSCPICKTSVVAEA